MNKFWKSVTSFLNGRSKRLQEVEKLVQQILPHAITATMAVSSLSGSKKVEDVARVLQELEIPHQIFNFDINKEYTEKEIEGILMGAASYALRRDISKDIDNFWGSKYFLNYKQLKKAEDIPDNILNTVVNVAYSFIKNKN